MKLLIAVIFIIAIVATIAIVAPKFKGLGEVPEEAVEHEYESYFKAGTKPTVAELVAVCRELGGDAVADALAASERPCLRLLPSKTTPNGPNSRVGGLPNLPKNVAWPKYNDNSMSFIAQVNLAEMRGEAAANALPTTGLLFFFYDAEQSTWGFDPKDRDSWAVIYSENVPDDTPTTRYPSDIPNEARYKSRRVAIKAGTSIATPYELLADLSLSEKTEDELSEAYAQYTEHIESWHQLLGRPSPVQGPMELECQLASHGLYCGNASGYQDPRAKKLEAGATDWRLLLQIDTDEDIGMMWGDCGMLYFWIRDEDLRKREFDKVWMILQCY